METRVALISIIVESTEQIGEFNAILHEYADYVIGRMGIPYKKKNINIISLAIDAPNDVINVITGRLGKLEGINAKAAYSKV